MCVCETVGHSSGDSTCSETTHAEHGEVLKSIATQGRYCTVARIIDYDKCEMSA